ncbi:MAG: hypothetical protein ACNA8W_14610 [Bradymonadaceae bacterium]
MSTRLIMKKSVIAAATAMALFSTACESRLTGKEGNLQFSYDTVGDFTDFNKPLATGARLDLKVAEAVTKANVTLEGASSDNEEVLGIHSYAGNVIVLEARGDGRAEIGAEAKIPSGEVVEDFVDMRVRTATKLVLTHSCAADGDAHYLVDQDFVVHYKLEDDQGERLIGYGYHPVEVEPAGALTIDQTSKDQRSLHLSAQSQVTTASLVSTIDATSATLPLVEESAIDGIKLRNNSPSTTVGTSNYVSFHPTVSDKPVCQARISMVAETSTPEFCSLPNTPAGDVIDEDLRLERNWVTVHGIAVGTCLISVTYPDALMGQGVTLEFEVEVKEL